MSLNRLDGFKETLEQSGLTFNPETICFQNFSLESGYEGFNTLFEREKRFTAIFAFSDFIAMGAMKAIKEKGLKIPEDISIVGFDNLRIADFYDPPLTTVNRFSKELSYLIVRTLQDLIRLRKKIENINVKYLRQSRRLEIVNRSKRCKNQEPPIGGSYLSSCSFESANSVS